MKLSTSIIAALVLSSNPLFAQGPGERVRITTSGGMMIGTVSEMSGGGI